MATVFPRDARRVSGGIEAVALHLIPALGALPDLELHVAAFSRDIVRPFEEVRDRVRFHWLPTSPHLSTARMLSIDAARLAHLERTVRPDVLHAQAPSPLPLAALWSGRPLVATVHGLDMFDDRLRHTRAFRGPVGRTRRRMSMLVMDIALRRANALIAISPHVQEVVVGRVGAMRSTLIENPVARAFFSLPIESAWRPKVLLNVGHLIERKDPVGVTQAFALVARRYPDWRLVFVGGADEPSYRDRLQRAIDMHHLDTQVQLAGSASEPQVLAHYAQSAALVHGALQEAAPMAISQAMAAGRPVVATAVGGVPWLVKSEVTGFLVSVGDVRGMASALDELMSDAGRRQLMGGRARKEAAGRFRPELVARQTADLYYEVLSHASPIRQRPAAAAPPGRRPSPDGETSRSER